MPIKPYIPLLLLLTLILYLRCTAAQSTYQLEYAIEVHADGSAQWMVVHIFENGEDNALYKQLSNYTYFTEVFVKSIKSIVAKMAEATGRTNMSVEKFVMTVSYNIVNYEFFWRKFAEVNDSYVKIGDVFNVDGLFLYGNGRLRIVYPSNFIIESVSPQSDVELEHTLTWYTTSNLTKGEPKIILREKAASSGFMGIWEYAVLAISVATVVSVSSISLYYFRFRKRKKGLEVALPKLPSVSGIENDEDKVINLLKGTGGSLYQSAIADQCRFSRSKTSKLLKAMEDKRKIKREERGREKVVTLLEEFKGDKQ